MDLGWRANVHLGSLRVFLGDSGLLLLLILQVLARLCACLFSVEVGSGLFARLWPLMSRLALGLICLGGWVASLAGQSV